MTNDANCVFCKIVSKDLSSQIVGTSDQCLAFHDMSPIAPTHILVIPKMHISSLIKMDEQLAPIMSEMILLTNKIVAEHKLADSGFRMVVNTGSDAGQTVDHLHLHILAGRKMAWPPG